ncbi:LysR family transcriptional regulator [Halomonas denitrificans]|uniref:LysR family transcriptional regulator n=1 Tax=Halomonas TaxID=2745 RepID=UPI001C97C6CA|nr:MULTISPECIES: LysR family transcriptional regulator [Halomonas]MBY5928943.1 LysR family transcriptional regulator [Halomonas sp. DP8Y7-3]MCA0974140.1 LysR family transcriptional regulator [Halomonas denitrificans]
MPSHHDTQLSGLIALLEVARHGSLRAAGEHLNLTSGAISRRLDALEDRLGVPLLLRTTRRVTLTDAGHAYLEQAVPALGILENAEQSLKGQQDHPAGTLRVSLPVNFGRLHIAPILPDFLIRYPDIRLEADFDDRFVDILESGHDLAVRVGSLEDSRLVAFPLASDERLLVASPHYLQRYRTPLHPLDLLEHNCLHYTRFQGIQRWRMRRGEDVHSLPIRGSFRSNYGHALVIAAEAGLGILHTSRAIVQNQIEQGRLTRVLADWSLPDISVHALTPNRHPPLRARLFIEFLRTALNHSTYRPLQHDS